MLSARLVRDSEGEIVSRLWANTQTAAFFVHPEIAAPIALAGCFLVTRALAAPLITRLPTAALARGWALVTSALYFVRFRSRADKDALCESEPFLKLGSGP